MRGLRAVVSTRDGPAGHPGTRAAVLASSATVVGHDGVHTRPAAGRVLRVNGRRIS